MKEYEITIRVKSDYDSPPDEWLWSNVVISANYPTEYVSHKDITPKPTAPVGTVWETNTGSFYVQTSVGIKYWATSAESFWDADRSEDVKYLDKKYGRAVDNSRNVR